MNRIRPFVQSSTARAFLVAAWVAVGLPETPANELARPGNICCYYISPVDGTQQPYFLYVPDRLDPSRPAPVVFLLHGFGGRTGHAASGFFMLNWADSHGWLLVNLDGRGSQNWDDIGEDDLFLVLEDLQRATAYHPALNVDPERLYVQGCSMGGHGAFREGFRYPQRFAAVAPGAGWTTYTEFYAHWYDAWGAPRLPDYADPARLPVLETASSLKQAENGRWVWTFITFDRNDRVNPPENQDLVIEALRKGGSDRYAVREGQRGHCGSFCTRCNFQFFLGKKVDASPARVVYNTNDIRYHRAYWAALDRLRYQSQWARLEVSAGRGHFRVRTRNLLGFSLDVPRSPLGPKRSVSVRIDDGPAVRAPGQAPARFEALLDARHQIVGWTLAGAASTAASPHKRPGLSGPIGDAFRSRFLVIYGTRGGSAPPSPSNPDWTAAQKFCTEWNQWTSLHWGGQRPPADRLHDWWIPPYPFLPGAHIPTRQPLVQPIPDTAFGLETVPHDAHLVLFGDPDTNWLIAQAAPSLPLGLSGSQVRVRERLYRSESTRYLFIAPSPFVSDRYLVVARGYLSSDIDPSVFGAGNVGKDLEALPFFWPDYVVWDAGLKPARTVQDPFRHLPETFLDAGYFNENWRLDTDPPVSTVQIERLRTRRGAVPLIHVSVTAADRPGGFGVQKIEWRTRGGDWRTYTAPLEVVPSPIVTLEVRAIDRCGQFVYGPTRTPNRGRPAAGNVESPQVFVLE
ncbi:MAG: prolyl oligopeptidase family serine peptidase [Planctomycetes bacterium]|nr:prolyl oligopeptidase family serine peptidase [Planctomycetota bacterium]